MIEKTKVDEEEEEQNSEWERHVKIMEKKGD